MGRDASDEKEGVLKKQVVTCASFATSYSFLFWGGAVFCFAVSFFGVNAKFLAATTLQTQ